MKSSNSTNTSMLHTKIKKTLVFALVVVSTLIYIAPAGATVPENNKQVSCRTASPTKKTGNANNTQSSKRAVQPKNQYNATQRTEPAYRGKPSNPIPAGSR